MEKEYQPEIEEIEEMEFRSRMYYLVRECGGGISVRIDRPDGPLVAGPFSTLSHSYALSVEEWLGEQIPVVWAMSLREEPAAYRLV